MGQLSVVVLATLVRDNEATPSSSPAPSLERMLQLMVALGWIERITSDPGIRGGEPCVRGTRVPVSVIVGSFADGDSVEQVLAAYPSLAAEDVQACLKYAAEAVRDVSILPLAG